MNSAAHRANILDRDYTEVGIGAVDRQRPGLGRRGVPAPETRHHQLQHLRPHHARDLPPHAALRQHRCRGAAGAGPADLRQTGFYGTYTHGAVSRFQKAQGWAGRGNVGPKTWSRLF